MYRFAQGTLADLPRFYQLISARIAWMDQMGIRQWNTTDYWSVYPESHYEALTERGEFYILRRAQDGLLVAGAALYEQDPRWPDCTPPAFYVHHLTTDRAAAGAGRELLRRCEDLARRRGKVCLRLDCAVDNAPLNRYYEEQGYLFAGTCIDGAYSGNLRQKLLVPPEDTAP